MCGIFTYIWVIIRANVGKYTSTMEHMGLGKYGNMTFFVNFCGGYFGNPKFVEVDSWQHQNAGVFQSTQQKCLIFTRVESPGGFNIRHSPARWS